MPILCFQELALPLLRLVADGEEHTVAASRDPPLSAEFQLTEEERREWFPSGAAVVWED